MSWLDAQWYTRKTHFLWKCLIPFEIIYRAIFSVRRMCYRLSIFKSERVDVPVIIIGNITVGGVGKTPLTAAIATVLQKNNIRPGIISRGYKGKSNIWPQMVDAKSDPNLVGDEPVLLAKKTGCPLMVGPDRVAAAKKLLEKWDVDVLLSDDGLQHYALARDIEVLVIDGQRGLGNEHCLPYGPLRESKKRLKTVDFVVRNETIANKSLRKEKVAQEYSMIFRMGEFFNLKHPHEKKVLAEFAHQTLQAYAGIGNPQRFFDMLRQNGLTIIEHPFPDHYAFSAKDFAKLGSEDIILMTEKDAIKCRFLKDPRIWVLAIEAELSPQFFLDLQSRLPCVSKNCISP